jgi:hypothetical protein
MLIDLDGLVMPRILSQLVTMRDSIRFTQSGDYAR